MKLRDAPDFGQFVKIRKTGEICRWIAFDPESESLMVRVRSGGSFPVRLQSIDLATEDEEPEFLRSERNQSGN